MSKKIVILSAIAILLTVSPGVVFAFPGVFSGNLEAIATKVAELIKNILWTIAVAFVIVMFVISGFKFLTAQGDPQQIAEARKALVWGLVGATVIVLAWSVITIVILQFGV